MPFETIVRLVCRKKSFIRFARVNIRTRLIRCVKCIMLIFILTVRLYDLEIVSSLLFEEVSVVISQGCEKL